MDSSQVKIYKQLGASPNPATDTLLGTDPTIEPDGYWEKSVSLSVGRHKVYPVSVDKAGNQSVVGSVKNVARLPVPMHVSEPIDWYIGELNNTYLGEIDVSV
ncbi:MAG: hypothetical protein PHV11_08480 [Candidatus Bipolaricaulis sp.]|jgi:hypothetical protein|nr:hypothetical protein [Candidatus Bipolaricaulis sp.]